MCVPLFSWDHSKYKSSAKKLLFLLKPVTPGGGGCSGGWENDICSQVVSHHCLILRTSSKVTDCLFPEKAIPLLLNILFNATHPCRPDSSLTHFMKPYLYPDVFRKQYFPPLTLKTLSPLSHHIFTLIANSQLGDHHTSSVKGQRVNLSGPVCHTPSAATIHLSSCSKKAAICQQMSKVVFQ